MITVLIQESEGARREWAHRARTDNAEQAIARAVVKHFGKGWCFIPDDLDAAALAYDAVHSKPQVIGAVWRPYWEKGIMWRLRTKEVVVSVS